jgi:hypothetical protein
MLDGDTEELYEKRQFGTASGAGRRPALIVIYFQLSLPERGCRISGGHD